MAKAKKTKPAQASSKGANVTYRTQSAQRMYGSVTDHPAVLKSLDKDDLADLTVKPEGAPAYDVFKQARINPKDQEAEGFF
jgi:hypothetical protein